MKWLNVEDVEKVCPSCACNMKKAGISRIKANALHGKIAYGWSSLPNGWTKDSVKKFWDSLTGDRKHKVTACIKKMEKHFGDGAGGFCAGLADMMEGKEWRKDAAEKKMINPIRNQPDYNEGRMQDAINDQVKLEEDLLTIPQNDKYTHIGNRIAREIVLAHAIKNEIV